MVLHPRRSASRLVWVSIVLTRLGCGRLGPACCLVTDEPSVSRGSFSSFPGLGQIRRPHRCMLAGEPGECAPWRGRSDRRIAPHRAASRRATLSACADGCDVLVVAPYSGGALEPARWYPLSMRRLFLLAVGLLSSACASRSVAGNAGTCDARRDSARADIGAVIDAHLACEKDADCQSIAFASNCFDSCTRAVNASGVSAVEAAGAKANAGVCANYESDGCSVSIPPCVPPMPPQCVAGSCT